MSGTGHLSVQQGKKVIVHMRDGSKHIGKFLQHKAKHIAIYETVPNKTLELTLLATDKIRTVSIYKENP